MNANFLLNEDNQLLDALKENLRYSSEIFFTSAFGSIDGFNLISEEFSDLMARAGAAKFCFDITQGMTSPDLIEELATYPGECSVRICIKNQNKAFLHSKVYLFEDDICFRAIVGSANFSRGGLQKNLEASIGIYGEKNQLYEDMRSFSDEVWGSIYAIDPIAHPKIFDDYRKLYDKRKKNEFAIVHAPEEIESLALRILNLNKESTRLANSTEFYYLLGAMTANAGYQDAEQARAGLFKFHFKSVEMNSRTPSDKGYITNTVDGNRLGNIRLPQFEVMRKDVARIVKELSNFALKFDPDVKIETQDNTRRNLNILVLLQFQKTNALWDELTRYVVDGTAHDGRILAYLPETVKKAAKELVVHYIRGYADFRSRLSHADRVGTAGKLRIAFQVDKEAIEFLYEFQAYLQDIFELEVNVNDGSLRNKDNMLRITADGVMQNFFHSGWRKRMAHSFAEFNEYR